MKLLLSFFFFFLKVQSCTKVFRVPTQNWQCTLQSFKKGLRMHYQPITCCKIQQRTNWQISQKQNSNFMLGLWEVFETSLYLKHKSYYGTGELPETLSSSNPWATGDGLQPSIFSLLPRVLEGKPGCVRMESSQVFSFWKMKSPQLCVSFYLGSFSKTV